MITTNETDARILIDDQLRAAGWNPADKSQVWTEVKTSGSFHGVAEPESQSIVLSTQDGDAIPTGRADYVLLDSRGRPLGLGLKVFEGAFAAERSSATFKAGKVAVDGYKKVEEELARHPQAKSRVLPSPLD